MTDIINPEKERVAVASSRRGWKMWGPYMSERQWGTVREDYSADGSAWEYFPHDHARSRAYRWGEDGIMGWCDAKQNLCFSVAMWNEKDSILKERLFGLTGNQGNHGEDVKEYYYYLDSTPTHSYVKMLYKYPQSEFPYSRILNENRNRNKDLPEFNLIDTGIFEEDKYFDVFTEYVKGEEEDILIKITVHNRGKEKAPIHLMPQIWFRNTWAWYRDPYRPKITFQREKGRCLVENKFIGDYYFYFEGAPEPLFCENETNHNKIYGHKPVPGFWKDGVNDYVITGNPQTVNPNREGTKNVLRYKFVIPGGGSMSVRLRLSKKEMEDGFTDYDEVFSERKNDCEIFYQDFQKNIPNEEEKMIQRQAMAGMFTTKQFYYFDVAQWLKGDMGHPPAERLHGRNKEWWHLNNQDIISMPDKWEYPWYAAWDLAFHTVPIALQDPDYAKKQLILLLREWYMHPNGQIPAYEWSFSDVNPPVHAWACWKVFEIERDNFGTTDTVFLERVFLKLCVNFTWWVNCKDSEGNNIFQGGFLGLDNIGVFDRSRPSPAGGRLEQADATSWMAMYSLNMLRIALELSKVNKSYEDMASKFLEHFLYIAGAIANLRGNKLDLWDDEDNFFYDVLNKDDGECEHLKIRSMVGLIPLFAVETLEADFIDEFPHFKRRLEWFLDYRPELAALVSTRPEGDDRVRRRFSLLREGRLKKILKRMLDPEEFLSDYGIRALSKYHKDHPFKFDTGTEILTVDYVPGESNTYMFGGNSNWRGPVWFPVNYLIIESLRKFYYYYKDEVKVEYPTGSGEMKNLKEIADDISMRLTRLFMKDKDGNRPIFADNQKLQKDPLFSENILFYEYFHGDSGLGIGANHQTGWTGLVAELIHQRYNDPHDKKPE
jgi:hypothetical protein